MKVSRLSGFLLAGWLMAACITGQGSPPTDAALPSGSLPSAPTATQQSASGLAKVPTRLVVFCAGSLILPFADLEHSFEAAHPDINVYNECHGSIQVIRHVTELHEKIDVVATADTALIPLLMYTTSDPDTGRSYADWYVRFAGNRLALAYSPHSAGADEIDSSNWYEVISRPGVKLGIADPRFDAAGYRALMALKLAEMAYEQPGIFNQLLKGRFRYPIAAFTEDGRTEIRVPEIVEPLPDTGLLVRGASIQLIALLESGDLDYAFEYESVIRQHNLSYVALPEAINLGAENQAENYARVKVQLDFQRFASVKPVFQGEPIGYGITIPGNAPNPQAAAQFIAFLLGPEGRSIMERNYHPLLDQPGCSGSSNLPAEIAAYCRSAP